MQPHILKSLAVLALGAMLLQGCISVEVHTPWNREASIKAAQQYANHIPLTVEQLKMMLVSDTTHSKVVVIYDIACHHCRENFAEYARLWHEMDTSQMRMYFVQTTCNDFPKVDELFASQNINPTLYYLLDDTPAFVATRRNEGRYLSIARYLCGRTDLTSPNGIPHYYHADRQGNITVSLSLGDLSAPKVCSPEGKCK